MNKETYAVTAPKSLLTSKTRTMEKQESMELLQLMMSEDSKTELSTTSCKDLGGLGQILYARLASCSPQTRVSIFLAYWVVKLSNGSPGKVVLWAWTLHNMAKQHEGGTVLSVHTWAESFPMGIPTEESLSSVWDGQKDDKGRNRVDDVNTWLL